MVDDKEDVTLEQAILDSYEAGSISKRECLGKKEVLISLSKEVLDEYYGEAVVVKFLSLVYSENLDTFGLKFSVMLPSTRHMIDSSMEIKASHLKHIVEVLKDKPSEVIVCREISEEEAMSNIDNI